MLGNFSYVNPTKLYFGEDALSHLHEELSNYGNRILLVYGGGSIKKNGVYDAVCEILRANGKKSMRMAESCQILPWKSCGKAVILHEKSGGFHIGSWRRLRMRLCQGCICFHSLRRRSVGEILFADGGCIL